MNNGYITYRPWSEADDAALRELMPIRSDQEIARELKRSRNAVFSRRAELGLSRVRVKQDPNGLPRQSETPFVWCGATMAEQMALEQGRDIQMFLGKSWGTVARTVRYLSRWVI